MFREPWFEILEVCDTRGRSMPDIAAECIRRHHVSLKEMRGPGQSGYVAKARRATLAAIVGERPDLSSGQIGHFLNRDPSTIRHLILKIRRGH